MIELAAPPNELVYLGADDLADLASHFGISEDAARETLIGFDPRRYGERFDGACDVAGVPDLYRDPEAVWLVAHWNYRRAYDDQRRALIAAMSLLNPGAPRRVLDYGAGIGTAALEVARAGHDVTIIEPSPPLHDFLSHRLRRRTTSARLVPLGTGLEDLPDQFDLVICFEVFEHLEDPHAALAALRARMTSFGLLAQTSHFAQNGILPYSATSRRYTGPRWEAVISGQGLRRIGPGVYCTAHGWRRVAIAARYRLWRSTGLWIQPIGRA